jgi:hypothetical protein
VGVKREAYLVVRLSQKEERNRCAVAALRLERAGMYRLGLWLAPTGQAPSKGVHRGHFRCEGGF